MMFHLFVFFFKIFAAGVHVNACSSVVTVKTSAHKTVPVFSNDQDLSTRKGLDDARKAAKLSIGVNDVCVCL